MTDCAINFSEASYAENYVHDKEKHHRTSRRASVTIHLVIFVQKTHFLNLHVHKKNHIPASARKLNLLKKCCYDLIREEL